MKQIVSLLFIILTFSVLIAGCDEGQQMAKPMIDDMIEPGNGTPPTTVGEMKTDETPSEVTEKPEEPVDTTPKPEEPADTTPPTVVEVGWYSDEQLTKQITENIDPGDTVYTKIIFSEPMQHVVANDNTARPVINYRINKKTRRYRIVSHGTQLASGTAKPKEEKDAVAYVGKVIIPEDVSGAFAVQIGGASADTSGNKIGETVTQQADFSIEKPPMLPQVTVTEVSYHSDQNIDVEIVLAFYRIGRTLYIRVVFSESMQHIIANDETARPLLGITLGDYTTHFAMKPHGTVLKSGEAKPYDDGTDDFFCMITVPEADNVFGSVTMMVDPSSVSAEGVPVAGELQWLAPLTVHKPPQVVLEGAPTGTTENDQVQITVSGDEVVEYRYAVQFGEECGPYSSEIPIEKATIDLDVGLLSRRLDQAVTGTVTLCVIGKSVKGGWQKKPTTVQWTRTLRAFTQEELDAYLHVNKGIHRAYERVGERDEQGEYITPDTLIAEELDVREPSVYFWTQWLYDDIFPEGAEPSGFIDGWGEAISKRSLRGVARSMEVYRLYIEHPEKSHDELLTLMQESIKRGVVEKIFFELLEQKHYVYWKGLPIEPPYWEE